jgi:hypothetical protein
MARFTRDCVCALAEWQEEADLQDAAVSAMALASLAINTDGGDQPLAPWVRALLSMPGSEEDLDSIPVHQQPIRAEDGISRPVNDEEKEDERLRRNEGGGERGEGGEGGEGGFRPRPAMVTASSGGGGGGGAGVPYGHPVNSGGGGGGSSGISSVLGVLARALGGGAMGAGEP